MTIATSDSRYLWRVDAALAFASQVAHANTHVFQNAPWASLQVTSGSGITDPNTGQMAFNRVADPENAAAWALLCRTSKDFDDWAGTGLYKTEVLIPGVSDSQCYNSPDAVWVATAVMFGADCLTPGNYSNVFDFHNNDGVTVVALSPINMIAGGGAIRLYRSSKINPASASDRDTEVVWNGVQEAGVWYRFVLDMRISPAAGDSPFLKLWVQKGSGPLTLVVDETHIIGYSDNSTPYYQKFGAYQWDRAGTSSITHWFKGFWILHDSAPGGGEPVIDKYEMLALTGGDSSGSGGGGGTTPLDPDALYRWAAVSSDPALYDWANLDASSSNASFDAVGTVTITESVIVSDFILNYAPATVANSSLTAAVAGVSGSQSITFAGSPTITATVTGLPVGASYSGGTLSWTTAIMAGIYSLTITPTSTTSGLGTAKTLAWTVTPATVTDDGAWSPLLRRRIA